MTFKASTIPVQEGSFIRKVLRFRILEVKRCSDFCPVATHVSKDFFVNCLQFWIKPLLGSRNTSMCWRELLSHWKHFLVLLELHYKGFNALAINGLRFDVVDFRLLSEPQLVWSIYSADHNAVAPALDE